MAIKPVHTLFLNLQTEEKVMKLNEVSDTDSHQEDDTTEEDSEKEKEKIKILQTTESYFFPLVKTYFITKPSLHTSLPQDTFLPPPDFV